MELLTAFWKYMVISSPYLLAGFIAAGVIRTFVSMDTVKKLLGEKSLWSIVKASLIGVPLPLCSCAVVPTAIAIKKSGANNGATSAFLISTPESGIDSIAMTYGMMDLPMTIIRPVAAFLSAFIAGVGQFIFNDGETPSEDSENSGESCGCSCAATRRIQEEERKAKENASCCSSKEPKRDNPIAQVFKSGLGELIEDVAFWMTVGLVVGAFIDYLIPPEFFTMLNGSFGKFVVLAIGIPFYICASASTPVAAAMMLKGMAPGTALIFLLVGPATNITNLLVLQKYIGKKGVIINIIAIAAVAFGLSFVVDFLYSFLNLPYHFSIEEHSHGHGFTWLQHACGVVFSLILLRGLWIAEIKPRLVRK